ncbi:MAG: cell division protein FtsK [Moritella sp.]|uniref:DNA translocase FtsK n=1 Tax=Moritella sp. TaxID=78556 RepID=UPI000C109E9E|nr:DNA translocase FtsK 4TM domain-containing protein [Moritella sp.]MBL1417269.1 DNA translocase FtsK 4TM domain-containing protein [Moritella sp.]PHR89766.1 MAG: cell division protein FtsK [Moritella sp.]
MNKFNLAIPSKYLAPLSGIQRVFEVGFILSTFIACYAMVALVSFDPADPSWSQTSWEGPVKNAAGSFGAWIGDVLFFTFGLYAYAIPLAFVSFAWFIFWRPRQLDEIDFFTVGLRMIGALLLLIGVCGLASVNFDDLYYFSSGGLIGDVVEQAISELFGVLGSTLILLSFVAIGFTLLTGISWLTIVDMLGAGVINVCQYSFDKVTALSNRQVPVVANETVVDTELDDLSVSKIAETPITVQPVDELDDVTEMSFTAARQEPSLSAFDVLDVEPNDDDQFTRDNMIAADNVDRQNVDNDSADEAIIVEHQLELDQIEPALAPVFQINNNGTNNGFEIIGDQVVSTNQLQFKEKPVTLLPGLELLDKPNKKANPISQAELDHVARLVEEKLLEFNIKAKVVDVHPGPVITRFELDLAPGIKVSKISALSKDLARSLSAMSVRIVEVIPGKSVIGLELPNKYRETVYLSDVMSSPSFINAKSKTSVVLGHDIAGDAVVVDLAKMPHLLVAGTTGSGKSVGVNVMIMSLLYKASPEEVRMIMIDPKMLELSVYEGIPHLLTEVVTDMKDAANSLRWCVGEMERRYKLLSAVGVRNLAGFNTKIQQAIDAGQPILDPLWKPGDSMDETAPALIKLPSIVVIVDEFADMMMIVGKKVEELIARIAQKARAAGIHLILATQRPSVDVITGLIKANIPSRIAFQVSSKIDSRTILDQGGAETLLGMGDMLYQPAGSSVPIRVHGAFVDDHEVHRVVADWKLRGAPNYIDEILNGEETADTLLPGEVAEGSSDVDELFDQAVYHVTQTRRGSVSGVQRKFKIGYNRAARIVEEMEVQGIVSSPGNNGNREVLAPPPPKD